MSEKSLLALINENHALRNQCQALLSRAQLLRHDIDLGIFEDDAEAHAHQLIDQLEAEYERIYAEAQAVTAEIDRRRAQRQIERPANVRT